MTQTFDTEKLKPKLSFSLSKLILLIGLLVIIYWGYEKYTSIKTEQAETSVFILTPQTNDIYFLDLKLFTVKLGKDRRETRHKYQLAKVVRITGENVVIVYGSVLYQWQNTAVNSIKFGELSNSDYFELTPDYIPFNKLQEMQSNGAIYLVKRPIGNKIYGNFVSSY